MLKSYGAINDESGNIAEKKSYGFVYFAAIAAAFNAVGMGISLTYTSSTSSSMMDVRNSIEITLDQITWIASIVQLSAIIGGCISGYLSKKLGRKAVLMYNSVPFLGSWLIITYAPNLQWIYVGRFITGICCGVLTVTVPTYLVEISSPENRGMLGSFFNVAVAIGVLMSMCLGTVITWRWLAVVGAIIVAISVLLLYFAPESPHWLIAKGHKYEACRALNFLRKNNEVTTSEYNDISDSLTENKPSFRFSELMQPMLYKPILMAIALTFLQQFCGINPLMAYTTEIFSHLGGFLSPNHAAIAISGVQVLACIFGTAILDRTGRRINHALSGLFISVGLVTIGLFVLFSNNNTSFSAKFGWMPVSGYIILLLAFAIGYGPLPFIMTAEMTPLEARSAVMGVATVSMYLFSFIVTKTFGNFQSILGNYGVYFMYAVITLIGVLFGVLYLPETKGSSLKGIQQGRRKNNILKDKTRSKKGIEP